MSKAKSARKDDVVKYKTEPIQYCMLKVVLVLASLGHGTVSKIEKRAVTSF
jgi:hypothetical protein